MLMHPMVMFFLVAAAIGTMLFGLIATVSDNNRQDGAAKRRPKRRRRPADVKASR